MLVMDHLLNLTEMTFLSEVMNPQSLDAWKTLHVLQIQPHIQSSKFYWLLHTCMYIHTMLMYPGIVGLTPKV